MDFDKRIISSILLLCFIMNLVLSIRVSAVGTKIYMENGQASYSFTDTKATSGIRYRTSGWLIHQTDENGNGYNVTHGIVTNIIVDSEEIVGTKVITTFKILQEDINKALVEANMGEWQSGQTMYMSSIFEVFNASTNEVLGTYYTLDDIKNAQNWTDDSSFSDYYDIPVVYQSAKYPIKVIAKTDKGIELYNSEDDGNIEDKESGETITYSFEVTITKNDIAYEYDHGYVLDEDGTKIMGDFITSDWTVINRIGGITIVGIYEQPEEEDPPQDPDPPQGTGDFDPQASAIIDSHTYDVERGIPTSEQVYVQVDAKEYLYDYSFVQEAGTEKVQATVTKTYNLEWVETTDEPIDTDGDGIMDDTTPVDYPQSDTETVTTSIEFDKEYYYWVVEKFALYEIEESSIQNYCLPGQNVNLTPHHSSVSVNLDHSDNSADHIQVPTNITINLGTHSKTIDGGDTRPTEPFETEGDLREEAEDQVPELIVKNDKLVIDGKTIMNDTECEKETKEPIAIPTASKIPSNSLYKDRITISLSRANAKNQHSTGTITYTLNNNYVNPSQTTIVKQITGINDVTVHTPVVCYPTIYDDLYHDQRINPTTGNPCLVLKRSIQVSFPNDGSHLSLPGYGNRDYEKYIYQKRIKFPFDVYEGTGRDGIYIPGGTWHTLDTSDEDYHFYIPTWVEEGENYEVRFLTIAENSPNKGTIQTDEIQMGANTTNAYHIAAQIIEVDVVGRLYDFAIFDITSKDWDTVFHKEEGKADHTGMFYYAGDKGIDGEPRQWDKYGILPIKQGSHPEPMYKNLAIKTGYGIRFALKTIGSMEETDDSILIEPTFYYMDKDGNNRQEVDVYYMDYPNDNYFVKVGDSARDIPDITVKMGDPYNNISEKTMKQTVDAYYNNYSHGLSYDDLYYRFTQRKRCIGGFSKLELTYLTRLFKGDTTNLPSGVDEEKVTMSEQIWIGYYYLPNEVYVVPKDTDVLDLIRYQNGGKGYFDRTEDFWLRDGYIVVNFNIKSLKDDQEYLSYNAPCCNQWAMENYQQTQKVYDAKTNIYYDFNFDYGDIALYYTNERSSQDFKVVGTH